jgi:KH domain
VVKRIKTELERLSTSLSDRVVIGVAIPAARHKILIGKGGQSLNDVQNRNSVQVQFPGSRSYGSVGEVSNMSELEGVNPADIVKIIGTKVACDKAASDLKASHYTPYQLP